MVSAHIVLRTIRTQETNSYINTEVNWYKDLIYELVPDFLYTNRGAKLNRFFVLVYA